ncbi:helix-turn-helix domain-containing protein [Sediminicola luteus]|uniref:HTH araC/xylS-type domain-containing protein n=1 Tax=Sediminicola luteus TaxID=319238 RepID=A0A2A4GEB9_9FLAO|nr:AraC family transcriptional regulator [Sediminicola luteus]PCE66145.1 hypothetical protein B7P33_02270 [Sediminicola luteus]
MYDHVDFGLRILALATLLFWSILIGYAEPRSARKWILLQFFLCLIAYILVYYPPVRAISWVFQPLFLFSVALPFSFWLVTKSMFRDDFQWRVKYLWWYTLPILQWFAFTFHKRLHDLSPHLNILPYLISIVFMLLAIYESIQNQHDDLIDSRRRNRVIAVVYSSVLGIISLFLYFTGDPINLASWASNTLLLGTPFFCSLFFWPQLNYIPLYPGQAKLTKETASPNDRIQQRILDKLETGFVQDKLYCTESMTIGRLAEQLQEKEYLLRKAINQGLGYRNFNDYLNQLRIEEAQRIMAAHRAKELTFQEMAYKLGYQSTATFNRAFKKSTGLTPTAYVKQV